LGRARILHACGEASTLLRVPASDERGIHLQSDLKPKELAKRLGVARNLIHIHDPSVHAGVDWRDDEDQRPTVMFGNLAVELGFLRQSELETLLAKQKVLEEKRSIGRLAMEIGCMSEEQIELTRYEQLLRVDRAEVQQVLHTKPATSAKDKGTAAKRKSGARNETIRVNTSLLNTLINLAG
jgi:hypothetical protein